METKKKMSLNNGSRKKEVRESKSLKMRGKLYMKKQIVQLLSPGLDSYINNFFLTKSLNIDLIRIYFNLNSRYSKNEINFLNKIYNKEYFQIMNNLDLHEIEEEDAYIPNRNLLLISMTSSYYQNINNIYINSVKDDRVQDGKPHFFNNLEISLSTSLNKPIKINNFFNWKLEKAELVKKYFLDTKDGITLLTDTYSCFSDKYIFEPVDIYDINYSKVELLKISGCRKCKACFRKFAALTSIGIYVPFVDLTIAKEYDEKIDKIELPNRYKSTQNYLNFLEEINDK